jgi:hypothetical protein
MDRSPLIAFSWTLVGLEGLAWLTLLTLAGAGTWLV